LLPFFDDQRRKLNVIGATKKPEPRMWRRIVWAWSGAPF
jgi:hypothetical protein